jgi:hypothetical protein
MNEAKGEFSELALRVAAAFADATDEAMARQVSAPEIESALERLGWRKVESLAGVDVLADIEGRRISVPTTGLIGMAPLLKALRAAAGLDDAAA